MEYYLTMRTATPRGHAPLWMDRWSMMPHKRRQTQKRTCCKIPFALTESSGRANLWGLKSRSRFGLQRLEQSPRGAPGNGRFCFLTWMLVTQMTALWTCFWASHLRFKCIFLKFALFQQEGWKHIKPDLLLSLTLAFSFVLQRADKEPYVTA